MDGHKVFCLYIAVDIWVKIHHIIWVCFICDFYVNIGVSGISIIFVLIAIHPSLCDLQSRAYTLHTIILWTNYSLWFAICMSIIDQHLFLWFEKCMSSTDHQAFLWFVICRLQTIRCMIYNDRRNVA